MPKVFQDNQDELVYEINVTPFVDVVLVLLIIFMITAPIVTKTIDINIPEEQLVTSGTQQTDFIIDINSKGTYYISGKKTPFSLVRRKVSEHILQNKKPAVFIRADKKITYEKITRMMAELKNLGIHNIGLLVRDKK